VERRNQDREHRTFREPQERSERVVSESLSRPDGSGPGLPNPRARSYAHFAAGAPESPPESVCVVMLSAIGDAVHVQPVLTAIKRAWPETHLTWIVQSLPMQVGLNRPDMDEFITFERRRGLAGWMGFRDLKRRVRGRHWDLVINLQVYLKAGLITALLKSPRKLGFDRRRARDLNWLFTTERLPPPPPGHVQDHYFEFLQYLGIDPDPVEWRMRLTPEEREAQRAFYADIDRPVCAIVLGASAPERNWPAEKYARVADELYDTHSYLPMIVGGPSAAERDAAEVIKARSASPVLDTLGDDLRRLMWLVDGADLMVSPDTGPLHIANAYDVPVVGIYGYTNPKRAGPYGRGLELIADGFREHPDEDYSAAKEYRDGMRRVTVEMVLEKIARAVERYGPG